METKECSFSTLNFDFIKYPLDEIQAVCRFRNGTEAKAKFKYHRSINVETIAFFVDVTPFKEGEIVGIYFKDKNGDVVTHE